MRILYYSWDEANNIDAMECLKFDGNEVEQFECQMGDKLNDVIFAKKLEGKLKEKKYDCIFTFNFFPIISKVAYAYEIKYISWVFDNPHLTLYSQAVFNEFNYIFCFDKIEVSRLRAYGVERIYHMPLAVNTKRLAQTLSKRNDNEFLYDVSFLGNLYNDETNFFNKISNVPEYYKGFFDALTEAQMKIYGFDLSSEIITDSVFQEIRKFVSFQLDNEIFIPEREIFIGLFQKNITAKERLDILRKISDRYKLTHFAEKSDSSLNNVDFQGYANYITKMPWIFLNSKINLNITLRSILSGISLRCLDIMGAGGFLISNYQPELAEYFIEDQEMVMYESHEDLMDKIEYYLSHDKERNEIAVCGKEKIEKEFSYEKKLREIFMMVFS